MPTIEIDSRFAPKLESKLLKASAILITTLTQQFKKIKCLQNKMNRRWFFCVK